MEYTCADRSMPPPLVIHKDKGLYCGWFTGVGDRDAELAHSDKGYMTDKLATKEHSWGQLQFLLMDSHRTHYSLKMIRYGVENNMVIMSYPGNPTHLLQPLGVCLFAPLQRAYCNTVAEHRKKTRTGVIRTPFRVFLLEHDEKHILYKISKHYAERQKLCRTIPTRSQSATSHHSRCRRHAKSTNQFESTKITSKPARTTAARFGHNNTHITKRDFIATQKRVEEFHFSTCTSDSG